MAPPYRRYLTTLQQGDTSENPILDTLGMQLVELEGDRCAFSMECAPRFMQNDAAMQGGMITALADETMAHSVMNVLADDQAATTIQLNINFLGPAFLGDRLYARSTLVKHGRSLVVGEALVTNQDDRLVARATATFMILAQKAND